MLRGELRCVILWKEYGEGSAEATTWVWELGEGGWDFLCTFLLHTCAYTHTHSPIPHPRLDVWKEQSPSMRAILIGQPAIILHPPFHPISQISLRLDLTGCPSTGYPSCTHHMPGREKTPSWEGVQGDLEREERGVWHPPISIKWVRITEPLLTYPRYYEIIKRHTLGRTK